ncbi:hypothetical protein B0J13DRAFT_584254 [Dactylonectria estremocensis]|uniref:NB-ARC domain-containing protein n=1 Tax=Dactylonectria estremocensis TaxID=1079267 RepID=A0A9P9EYA5_9HYPO|nr:hypothetical protein B0J13DRAFT_584254 [Dactylonectria estremocensis]
MEQPAQRRDLTGNQFGDNAAVHQGDNLDRLLPQMMKHCSVALWGLGPRKTQIALDYAYRQCEDDNCSVFWVHADSEATFVHDYQAIAKELSIDRSLKNEDLLIAATEQATEQTMNLCEYIPRGTVSWTSCDERIVGALVGARRGIEVARMTSDEAQNLLQITRIKETRKEEIETATLLQELQWPPLAISQAGAYMRRTLIPIKERNVPNSILETEIAYRILHIIAFLDYQNLPYEILAAACKYDGEDPTQQPEELAIIQAITRLKELSFIGVRGLVQEATRYGLSVRKAMKNGEENITMDLFSILDQKTWPECEKYLIYAMRLGEWAELCGEEAEIASLLRQWREKGLINLRGLELRRKVLGEKHLDTIRSMAYLAITYYAQGRYNLQREMLGEKHPDTIRSMADLATTYNMQG